MVKAAELLERQPVAIMCAPNGGRLQQTDHPALPIGPEALAENAQACAAEGASAFHFHVRDDQGQHCLDVDRYREATDAIRSRVGEAMHLQVTTEAQGQFSPETQLDLVRELVPEGVSLALREILPQGDQDVGWRAEVSSFFEWMTTAGIGFQLILYSARELSRLARFREAGILPTAPLSLLFVLGSYVPPRMANPAELVPFVANMDPHDSWWMAAFGPEEGRCALTAANLGGHIRVGFENNFTLLAGDRAPDNASLVRDVANALAIAGVSIAQTSDCQRYLNKPGT